VRLRIVLSYDGSGFHGFAAQPGQKTVAGELARAVSNYCRHAVELVCAGRTDSGVHAFAQVVHTDVDPRVDPAGLKRAVNRQLSPRIVARSVEIAPADFDARHSAVRRTYRYLLLAAPEPDPVIAGFAWQVPEDLDLRSMRAASDVLLGEHDFGAFCRRPPGHPANEPITRRVLDAGWTESIYYGGGDGALGLGAGGLDAGGLDAGRLLRFEITATSFCHQMVRSVVGALVDVGRGRLKPSDVPRLLESGDRSGAKTIAPPHGLCLMSVGYA
jgi:tRNA pseudouridine38-40 synthase